LRLILVKFKLFTG